MQRLKTEYTLKLDRDELELINSALGRAVDERPEYITQRDIADELLAMYHGTTVERLREKLAEIGR